MKKFVLGSLMFIPALAFAQVSTAQDVGALTISLINTVLVPVVFALSFLVFIWGIFNYFIAGGSDEEKRDKGKKLLVWGLIGFFVMLSVWGLVNVLVRTAGLDNGRPQPPNAVPGNVPKAY
jgi:hypothetical protein